MGRTIFKTIVSAPHEFAFVELNIIENYELVDHFLICEAEYSHTGVDRGFRLEREVVQRFVSRYPKCQYIQVKRNQNVLISDSDSAILHANEQMIRNGFTNSFKLERDDIVISVDADEILFKKRTAKFIRKLRRKYFKSSSYVLKLHQMIYLIGCHWTNCNFRGPVISLASHFLDQENPQWRYSGVRTFRKSGTHFSWVMTPEEMKTKIENFAHRDLLFKFADIDILSEVLKSRTYIFDPDRKFHIREIKSISSKKFPSSLKRHSNLFCDELFVSGMKK